MVPFAGVGSGGERHGSLQLRPDLENRQVSLPISVYHSLLASLETSYPKGYVTSEAPYRTVDFEGFVLQISEGYITKFAPHKAL
jgi:hypothetical protein